MAEVTEPYQRLLALKDGGRVHVRPIRPDDEDRLHEALFNVVRPSTLALLSIGYDFQH